MVTNTKQKQRQFLRELDRFLVGHLYLCGAVVVVQARAAFLHDQTVFDEEEEVGNCWARFSHGDDDPFCSLAQHKILFNRKFLGYNVSLLPPWRLVFVHFPPDMADSHLQYLMLFYVGKKSLWGVSLLVGSIHNFTFNGGKN